MYQQVLEYLFESNVKVKILKFLFRNSPGYFTIDEFKRHTQESPKKIKNELENLEKVGLIKSKIIKIQK